MYMYLPDNTPRFGGKKRVSWQRFCCKSWRLWIGQRCLQIRRIRKKIRGKLANFYVLQDKYFPPTLHCQHFKDKNVHSNAYKHFSTDSLIISWINCRSFPGIQLNATVYVNNATSDETIMS